MGKGQMSIQMIVALVILLVVAVVTIRVFLKKMGEAEQPQQNMKEIIRDIGFEGQCERLCNEYKLDESTAALAKYCYTKLEGDTDLNNNGLVDSFNANTKVLPICEDGVYCFHVVECKTNTGVVDWEDCRKTVCDEYSKIDGVDVDGKVKELFPSEGSCDLPRGENWWDMYFGPIPCSFPPGILGLKDCSYDSDTDELICTTNCGSDPDPEIVVVLTDTDADPVWSAVMNVTHQFLMGPDGEEDFSGGEIITFDEDENEIKVENLVSNCSKDVNFDFTDRDDWFVFLVSTGFPPEYDIAYVQGVE